MNLPLNITHDELVQKLTTGEQLINALKLSKFKYIWIQKITDTSIPIFIISVDSRRPSTYFAISKLRKLDSTIIKRTKRRGYNTLLMNNPRLRTPIPLQHFNGRIGSNAIIIRRDIAGEYFMNDSLYESFGKSVVI